MTCLLAFAWMLDRVEPPWAVLIHADGTTLEVPVTELPPGVREGDVLASPLGPVDRAATRSRRARNADRLRRLTRRQAPTPGSGVAGRAPVGEAHRMSRRRTPDHFARRARREGFAARSVYKLEEIDRRVRLFQRGQAVLDLGSAPGSWLQYIGTAVGPRGRVVGIDLKEVTVALPAHVEVHQGDAFEVDEATFGTGFDVVTSDMAPATTGNRLADHARSVELCRRALTVARAVLRPGGAFVCKVFEGEDVQALFEDVRARFETARRIKPKGTRSESVELFVVGLRYRPGPSS